MNEYNPNLYNTGVFETQPYQPQSNAISGSYQPTSYTSPDAGSGLNAAGDNAMSSGNPYVMAGGVAAKAIGTGLDFYGKYEAREEARRAHEEALSRYNEEKRIEAEDRAREQNRQNRQEAYVGGEYSQDLEDRFSGSYGGYRQPGAQ